jgi:hypothetical protein
MDFCRAPVYRANSAWIFVGHRFTVTILHGFLSGTGLPCQFCMDFVGHRFIVPILVFCLYDPVLSWATIYRAKIKTMAR